MNSLDVDQSRWQLDMGYGMMGRYGNQSNIKSLQPSLLDWDALISRFMVTIHQFKAVLS